LFLLAIHFATLTAGYSHPLTELWKGPSLMCGEAGLHAITLADLAARAEADGIIPLAGFCVNVQMAVC